MTPVWIAGLWVSMGRRRPLSGSIANAHTLGWVPATHLTWRCGPPGPGRSFRDTGLGLICFQRPSRRLAIETLRNLTVTAGCRQHVPFLLRERLVDLLKALLDPG